MHRQLHSKHGELVDCTNAASEGRRDFTAGNGHRQHRNTNVETTTTATTAPRLRQRLRSERRGVGYGLCMVVIVGGVFIE